MNLIIELPDELRAALKAQAEAQGGSPDRYVTRMLENNLAAEMRERNSGPPFETGYGVWAKYGPAPSAEEIEENRRDMFRSFAQDL